MLVLCLQSNTSSHCGGYTSSESVCTSGVSQGSHLGSLLCILYINDIQQCFKHSNILLYTDDLKVYRRVEYLRDCEEIQSDLDRFTIHCSDNGQSFQVLLDHVYRKQIQNMQWTTL